MPLDSVRKIKECARRLYVSHKGAFMELLLDIEPGVSVLEYYGEGKWTKDLNALSVLKHQRRDGR